MTVVLQGQSKISRLETLSFTYLLLLPALIDSYHVKGTILGAWATDRKAALEDLNEPVVSRKMHSTPVQGCIYNMTI